MSERAPTLAQLRAEARRVFGKDARVGEGTTGLIAWPGKTRKRIVFECGGFDTRGIYADARRFALETLRQLPTKETP